MRACLHKKLCTAQERTQILLHILHLHARHAGARDEQQPRIRTQLMLHMAICLAQEALRAAAHGGAAEFFPGGKADFARNARIAQNVEDYSPPRHNRAVLIDILKIAPLTKSLHANFSARRQ